jgi:gluconate kinase
MKHGQGNPFKDEERKYWLNPSRRDNLDITRLRKRYGE